MRARFRAVTVLASTWVLASVATVVGFRGSDVPGFRGSLSTLEPSEPRNLDQSVFTSRVQGVIVDVLVTERGKPVHRLTAADFELGDNGVLQKFEVLDSATTPVNAVLALDMSNSTSGQRLTDLRVASHALLDGLTPIDRGALTTFSHVVMPSVPLTGQLPAIRAALDAASPSGETALIDGVYAALMAAQPETGRSLVVVCTDGHGPRFSTRTPRLPGAWLQARSEPTPCEAVC